MKRFTQIWQMSDRRRGAMDANSRTNTGCMARVFRNLKVFTKKLPFAEVQIRS